MKNLLAVLIIISITAKTNGQWTEVNTNLSNLQVSSMYAYLDTLFVGTFGGGIFKSTNNGDSWTNISGDLSNLQINDIRGGAGSKIIWVSTTTGAYLTYDISTYSFASDGVANQDISYYWFGGGDGETDWVIGTNGAGVFSSPEITGPWVEINNGLTGDALKINDITGYSDEIEYTVLATENGLFYSQDSMRTWINASGTLTGDQLKINKVLMLGVAILVVTDAGYYATLDFGSTWIEGIPNELMNVIGTTAFGPGGIYYLMGENAYASTDLQSWTPINLGGVAGGNITTAAANSQYLFIGTEIGGVFRKKLDQLTSVEEVNANEIPSNYSLSQNYPNPFNPSTNIEFSIPKAGMYSLVVFNTLGQEVATLINDEFQPGKYKIDFNAHSLASGIYVYRFTGQNVALSKKMLLIK